jgi:hypothetical protein
MDSLLDKVMALEFRRTASGQLRATSYQIHSLLHHNLSSVRVLLQERHGASLKVARDPPSINHKNTTFWIFESGFIKNLPWDPGEWHWKEIYPHDNMPFFGYTAKRGYRNAKGPAHSPGIIKFINDLDLRNSTTSQVVARIWHTARPRKVGTLIWLTLNQGLSTGTWLQVTAIPPTCNTCDTGTPESPQHCLLDCLPAQRVWVAFRRVWEEWKAPEDITINWPFVLLGEAPIEREDDPPGLHAYHTGSFTYLMQPLDILRTFILYYLWSERCRKHFDDCYSLNKVLQQAWVATVEVGMATWKAIRAPRLDKDLEIQDRIELAFKNEWLHLNIFGSDNATIRWHFLPPLYFSLSDYD